MKRFFYRILAILCIILGIIGAVLPVMPTMPFLLAALYFAADEPRIQNWLNSNRYLKKYLELCQGKQPIPRYGKIAAISGLWISLIISGYFLQGKLHWQIVLAIIGTAFSIHIIRLKK